MNDEEGWNRKDRRRKSREAWKWFIEHPNALPVLSLMNSIFESEKQEGKKSVKIRVIRGLMFFSC
jgi:hypothetical protein